MGVWKMLEALRHRLNRQTTCNLKSKAEEAVETIVAAFAVDFPAYGRHGPTTNYANKTSLE